MTGFRLRMSKSSLINYINYLKILIFQSWKVRMRKKIKLSICIIEDINNFMRGFNFLQFIFDYILNEAHL